MFTDRYFHKRYWTTRYFTRSGTAIETCVYVQGSRNRFGTKKKFGTCLKFGDGFSDPWLSLGVDPAVDPFYVREIPGDVLSRHDTTLLNVDNRDELSVNFGGVPDEVFHLQSPNGTVFRVTIDGDTGHIEVEGAAEAPIFGTGDAFQLAMLEEGNYWEPGLPVNPASIDVFVQWHLLLGVPFDLTQGAGVSGNPVNKHIVDFDGDVFAVTVLNTGELQFSDDWESHDAETAFTPTYTIE